MYEFLEQHKLLRSVHTDLLRTEARLRTASKERTQQQQEQQQQRELVETTMGCLGS